MKTVQLLIVGLLMATTALAGNENQPVNAVIGDQSFIEKYGNKPNAEATEQLRIQTHLEYVEQMLRSKSTAHLSAKHRENRHHLIELLHEYRLAAQFPVNHDYPDERKPCFLDANGNICAVGYLVQQTAGMNLVNQINNQYKYAYLPEMDVPELTTWVQNSGLTVEECAIIQPTYNFEKAQDRIIEPEPEIEIIPNDTFVVVEKMPEPVGGYEAMSKLFKENIQMSDSCESGKVFVQFVVDPKGNILNPRVIRGYCKENDAEAIRLVKMLAFTPGEQRGVKRYVRYNLPVQFIKE